MNSIPPSAAGVPSSGNKNYIIIALLLLLGVGGLGAWKFSQKDPPPVAPVVTTVAAPATTKPKVREEDLPPPPEDPVPTATATAKGTAGPATNGGGGGCPASCGGTVGDDLRAALAMRGRQARRCYTKALELDAKATVHMTMSVRVSSSGGVCSVNVASSDNPQVAACVSNSFRSGGYPAPKGGCVDVNVPLNFVTNQ
jgi:hypothetical protein